MAPNGRKVSQLDPSDFTSDSPGRIVRTTRGQPAFVPKALSPDLSLDWALVSALSAADRALSELAGIGRTLPNPHILIRPFTRVEAVQSSQIEGTQASFRDLALFDAAEEARTPGGDVREVANYMTALDRGLDLLRELPITLRLLREVHSELLTGVRGHDLRPGQFRDDQVHIGPPGAPIHEATFVPPPPAEMAQCLYALERFINEDRSLPILVRVALIHYQFEAIHPFRDGNGRIGRLLITLMLCSEGVLPSPLLYLSAFFMKHRQDYYDLLLRVSQRGDWSAWLRFFLRGVEIQSRDALRRADALRMYYKSCQELLRARRSAGHLLRLLDDVFADAATTARRAQRSLGITARAAQQNIDRLVDAGILHEATGRQRSRIYIAPEIMRIITAAEAAAETAEPGGPLTTEPDGPAVDAAELPRAV